MNVAYNKRLKAFADAHSDNLHCVKTATRFAQLSQFLHNTTRRLIGCYDIYMGRCILVAQ